MSGGTQVALAADEVVMSKHSVLGPIDAKLDILNPPNGQPVFQRLYWAVNSSAKWDADLAPHALLVSTG
jgi:hypothetical protein